MAKRNTKELILLEALKLFADKGYEGVSVRDIAAEVGIRQSSLYKHFESKQDIFDTLVETMKIVFHKHPLPSSFPMVPYRKWQKNMPLVGQSSSKRPAQKSSDFI